MQEIEFTDFGGTGPFGSIPKHQDRYGEYQVRVVNNLLRPVSPNDPTSDGRIYRLVEAFVTHYETDFESQQPLRNDHEVILDQAVELTADEFARKPATIKNVYRDLYEEFENPLAAFRTDLVAIASHLTDETETQ